MKKFFSYMIAGMAGGLCMLAGIYFISPSPAPFTQQAGQAVPIRNLNVSATTNAVPFDFKEAAATSTPAVVHISASAKGSERQQESDNPFNFFFGDDFFFGNPFDGPKKGTGSGVIYATDGYIITNNHVVEFADQVEVTLFDNRTLEATIVGRYPKGDLAVLKIEANNLSTLQLADSDKASIGEWVLAVGNPFDLTSTVTAGIISAKGRSLQMLGGEDAIEAFIQTDAAVNPGNSGGALVDAEGRLLGINTAIATKTGSFQGYSFAIPINLVKRIVDDIIEYGSFQRAFLGIKIYELDSEAATELGVSISQGVVIDNLQDGGSAQYAGLLPKDIIVQVDGKEIKTVPDLQEIVGRAKVGDVLQVIVNRRGENMSIPVTLKAG
ncbi:MAG: trypsin-like peptidase domain-containing protein [Bacteroidota bacterium]